MANASWHIQKVRKSEAFRMCMDLTDGHCTCQIQRRHKPCQSLVWPLRNANGSGERAAQIEREKMAYNSHFGTFITLFSGTMTMRLRDSHGVRNGVGEA